MRWPGGEDFWLGANLPWFTYGCDFGANRWQPDGGIGRPDRRERARNVLERLADGGASRVRWFMLADGRAGLLESPAGDPIGLDQWFWRDVDAGLDALWGCRLSAILVLFDFHWFSRSRSVNGVRAGGRGRSAADPVRRRTLLDAVVGPILERYGRHPAVAAWEVVNEPEWVTRRLPLPLTAGVSRAAMRAFIRDVVETVHGRTSHAATVGSASTRTLRLVEGLGLDLYQTHWYDHLERRASLDRPVASLGLDRPVILGEFPTRGSFRAPAAIVSAAREAGFAGALAWSALAGDEASDADAMALALRPGAQPVGNRSRLDVD